MNIKQHVMFPTIIWEIDFTPKDSDLLLEMKRFSIKNRNSNPKGINRSNFGGWHSNLFNSYPIEINVFGSKVEQIIMDIRKEIDVPSLKLSEFWLNINGYGDYNKLHNHPGSFLSGVFYIDAPSKNMGDIHFLRGDDMKYYINKLPNPNNFTGQNIRYTPKSGKLLIFPSWLEHHVDGNRSKEKRISLSFNYKIN
jgi:uncharacterized protein (TIGR02466 family)